MERKFKGTPPRLPVVFQSYDPPLYLVTFNTLLRRPLLACDEVHRAFQEYAERGLAFHAAVGRYVLMPDHVHLFVRIGRDMTLRRWESGLKQCLGKKTGEAWSRAGNDSRSETEELLAAGILRPSPASQRELRAEMGLRLAESSPCGPGDKAGGLAVSR